MKKEIVSCKMSGKYGVELWLTLSNLYSSLPVVECEFKLVSVDVAQVCVWAELLSHPSEFKASQKLLGCIVSSVLSVREELNTPNSAVGEWVLLESTL